MTEGQLLKPRQFTKPQMKAAGVEVLNRPGINLRCVQCGQKWRPRLIGRGRLPGGYWRCPQGCNGQAEDRKGFLRNQT